MEQYLSGDALKDYKKAAKAIRAVNHKLRIQILTIISENSGINVTAIYVKLRLEQSVASQHLRILRDAGIVTFTRSGKELLYSINEKRLSEIRAYSMALATFPATPSRKTT